MTRMWLVGVALANAVSGAAQTPASAPGSSASAIAAAGVSMPAIDAHLRFLSHDLLEGRAPATRGGRLAAEYIAAQYRAFGLEPAGPQGSYFQPVALVGMTAQPTFVWGPAGATRTLRYLDDFVAWAERPETSLVADGDVVFVGYGITAPEERWDDFKDQSLRGKILLIMVNDPGLQDSTVFKGKVLTYYGRWTYKLEEAARRGAVGAILIHTNESATYPWEVVRSSWSVEQFKVDQPREPSLQFAAWVSSDAARGALARAGLGLDSLMHKAARRDFAPVTTGLHAAVQISTRLRRASSENVVARLPGSDAARGREAVLFTAHWDHKGIGPIVNGDSIYNGAEDNASGVAAMLGAAQALARAPRAKRPILFLATTAEESGLLGSEAYVRNPVVPLDRTAGVLNLDVTNVRGRTRDIAALGADRSSLGRMFVTAARAESLTVTSEPDLRGSFYRSDHFPFARAGVPALSIEPGLDFVGQPAGWGQAQDSVWNETRYHQASDEYARDFDLAGTAQQVRVAVRLALAIANAPGLPSWVSGSEFQRPGARP